MWHNIELKVIISQCGFGKLKSYKGLYVYLLKGQVKEISPRWLWKQIHIVEPGNGGLAGISSLFGEMPDKMYVNIHITTNPPSAPHQVCQ